MKTFIKNLIPLEHKHRLVSHLRAKELALPKGPRAFVFLAADYGNIGDMAITSAQQAFIKQYLPEHKLVTIPVGATREVIRSVRRQIQPQDVITLIGGGNMGVMYPEVESLRQLVISSFPQHRIVCFPQTLDWDNSPKSDRALRQIVRSYTRHSDLHVFAREIQSHHKLAELFCHYPQVKVHLAPDIVMSVTASSLATRDEASQNHILRCLRADKEAALSSAQYSLLDAAMANTRLKVEHTDTLIAGSNLDADFCATALADKLSQFRAARLVVTDRLHGMIFCLLTGTPCLVLSNSNQKIQQTWLDWLKDQERIAFVNNEQFYRVPEQMSQLLTLERGEFNEVPLDTSYYYSLQQAITHHSAEYLVPSAQLQQKYGTF